MRGAIFFLALASAAGASPLGFGVKAGMPLTDVIKSESWKNGTFHPSSGRYLVGPVVELRLPFRLAIEFNVLYRSLKYRQEGAPVGSTYKLETTGNAWQFPLLAKVRLGRGLVAPYVAGGATFNRLSGLKEVGQITDFFQGKQRSVDSNQPGDLERKGVAGFVAGVGLEGRLPVVRISPEIRYTRWNADNFRSTGAGLGLSNRNQLEALVGITF